MHNAGLTIEAFEPIRMWVENIGPFRQPFQLDFTDENSDPCNFFLLIAGNGRGKTTLLDIMAALWSMLDKKAIHIYGQDDLSKVFSSGGDPVRAQLDILVRFQQLETTQTMVLSLIAESEGASTVTPWTEPELKAAGAVEWCRFGVRKHSTGRLAQIRDKSVFVDDLLNSIRQENLNSSDGFSGSIVSVPTLLYFSAYRDIPKISEDGRSLSAPENWKYYPVRQFLAGDQWAHSLDNLLVWLKWLDDERFERAVDDVNRLVFRDSPKRLEGVQKAPPQAVISNKGQRHRLDQLSSGEKSLTQMILRIGSHMTRNTWVVIDELDIHLHLKWQHRILNALKKMVRENPGLRVIASTHSREILHGFQFEVKEPGLRKGGHIIDENSD